MTVIKKERLFRIASEINIGKDAIVAFLKSKGFVIENKPTQMLTEDMVSAVYDKFKRELRAVEVQREKIDKVNETRKVFKKPDSDDEDGAHHYDKSAHIAAKPTTPSVEPKVKPVETPPVFHLEKIAPPTKEEPKPKETLVPKIESPQAVAKLSETTKVANVGDVIDLNLFKNQPKPTFKDAKPKETADKNVKHTEKKKEAPKQPKPEHKKADKEIEKPKDNTQPKIDKKPKVKDIPADKIVEKPVHKAESHKAEGTKAEKHPKPDQEQKDTKKEIVKEPNAAQVAEPVQEIKKDVPDAPEFVDTYESDKQSRQLKGLTVLGKIDISKKPVKKAEPEKPRERQRDPNKAPRDGDRPPRDPNRPPRDNDRPRDPNRPPRDNDRPRDPNRPPRDNDRPRDPNRPPRDPNRPPRDPNRPPRDNDRPRDPNRPPRDPNRPIRDAVKPGEASTDGRFDRKDRKPRIYREIDITDAPKVSPVSSDRYPKAGEKPELPSDKKYKPKIKSKAVDIDEETKKNALKDKDKKRKKKKKSIRELITKEDVDRAVRETMLDMDTSFSTGNRTKLRQKRKEEKGEKIQREFEESQKEEAILKLTEFVTTSDLAGLMSITPSEIILKCMELGLMVSINQRLDKDTLVLIADDYGFEIEFVDEKQLQFIEVDEDDDEDLQPRPPIVTIMGHVDHGKTSLLDHIRKANVVAGEAGGITQHIGAYTVKTAAGKAITFLDTPGHEAFTAMRARGAQATDLVVLVVAADDSVMPQTIEAISHSKAANVPIVVAINKIDKADANPDRIRQQLTDHGILVEEWGGKYQCAEISAKKGINIEGLLEKILIESEMLDLKANPDRLARGVVIESQMSKGFGPVSTVIVQKGTLKVGDAFVSGVFSGRVRAMLDDKGVKIETAGPSQPVLVIGYDGLPEAGDGFMAMKDDADVRKIANERKQLKREQEFRQVHHITLDEISAQIQIGGVKDLNLVIKADVAGSLEALSDSLQKLSTEEVRVNILHKGVGPISETDVMLAAASQAVVIAFNINPTTNARRAAEKEFVDIRRYDIIYDCINEVQLALEGLLAPELVEKITGTVEVRQTFKISRTGTIAGCMVLTGKIMRNDKVRLMRDGFKVYEGTINSLKREKDDAREVLTNYECGIMLNNFNDLKPGDIVEAYTLVEKKRYLN